MVVGLVCPHYWPWQFHPIDGICCLLREEFDEKPLQRALEEYEEGVAKRQACVASIQSGLSTGRRGRWEQAGQQRVNKTPVEQALPFIPRSVCLHCTSFSTLCVEEGYSCGHQTVDTPLVICVFFPLFFQSVLKRRIDTD